MEIIYLGNPFPPENIEIPPDLKGTLLVFETTLPGYRAVVKWMNTYKESDVYRLVVPYAQNCKDIGDYLCTERKDEPLSKYTSFSADHVFSQVEECSYDKDSNRNHWPFPSTSRLVDFVSAVQHMEDEVMLRDPISGLNKIQEYMLQHKDKDTAAEELWAVAAVRFQMPASVIKAQYDHLMMGNRPPWFFAPEMGVWAIPNALVNGPYPFAVDTTRDGIIQYLNLRETINWNHIPAASSHHRFVGNVCPCEYDGSGSIITRLPYGVTQDEFVQANPGSDMRTTYDHCCFDAKYAHQLTSVTAKWDPVFLGKQFATTTDYMEWWIEETTKLFQKKRAELQQEADVNRLQRSFLQEFYNDALTYVGPYQKPTKKFKSESMDDKRARIDAEYGGHQEFLDLPVSMIDEYKIIIEEYMTAPSSSVDLWISILRKL